MAYEGVLLDSCGTLNVSFAKMAVVAVSGSGPNLCGHLMLYSPSRGGYYFHVAGIDTFPRYMNEAGYHRYLKENKKRELRRRYLALPDPDAAYERLEDLMSDSWVWGVLPHNCVAFVEDVIAAGGGTWSSYSNCPSVATADTVEERVGGFMSTLENEIYRAYGVPR